MATNKQIPQLTPKIEKKFWDKVNLIDDFSLCWNWNGWIKGHKKPYGVMSINNDNFTSHRLAYYINYGIDPKELHVLHKCDNHRCVNPNHLFLGTNADNIADKVSKGRQAKNNAWNKGVPNPLIEGELHPQSKLTSQQVMNIRNEYKYGGTSSLKLAKKNKVSKRLILNIINRKSWKHI